MLTLIEHRWLSGPGGKLATWSPVLRPALALVCAVAAGLIYFAAARFGLALLVRPEGVAVFWPASGIAAGGLMLLGPLGRVPVAAGVIAGTIAANLLGDRDLTLAVIFGLCNAGEALLFAWAIERRFGWSFHFADLRSALWFLASAAVSAALMAMLAAMAIRLTGHSPAPWPQVWLAWWAADTFGIVLFAPFLIALAGLVREPASGGESGEGLAALGLLVLVTLLTYLVPPVQALSWMPVPVATIFPLLLWLAIRCRPIFLTAGILLVGLIIVWAMTRNLGHFGNPAVQLADRVLAARITLLSVAFCGLALLAVFGERRATEATLRANEARFSTLAASAPGMIGSFRIDKEGWMSMPYASAAITEMLGPAPEDVRTDAKRFLRLMHPDDVEPTRRAFEASRRSLTPVRIEHRYLHPVRGEIWHECHCAPVAEADGSVVWHGFLQDITQRKATDARIRDLVAELNHRSRNLLAVVQAVAFHTAREEDPGQFVATFSSRIAGLAASHDLLTSSAWSGAGVADLVHSQLAHFRGLIGTRIILDGPPVRLAPTAAQIIGMALHELATNASKYGALACDRGKFRIAWSGGAELRISWAESGGEAPAPPLRQGFGHRVMVEMAEHQLDAKVRLDFPASRLRWELVAPAERTLEATGLERQAAFAPAGMAVS